MSRAITLLIGALAACALSPAAARAAAVVYVEDHDVVVSSPDGRVKQRLTDDGGPDTNYVFPVRDDAGSTVAARHASETSDATLYRWDAQGRRTDMNLLPKPGLLVPVLPIKMALSRDGRHVVYGWSYTDVDMSRREGVRVVYPDVYTPPSSGAEPSLEGWESPTFHGDRLVVSSGVPAGPGGAAYRIVQEALTNARKHGRTGEVAARVACLRGRVTIAVTSDGARPVGLRATRPADRPPALAVGGVGGHGLLSMHERVRLYGGRLRAGLGAGGVGWSVEAELPCEEARGSER